MISVACVLRSGPLYNPRWVHALRRGVAAHLKAPHEFVVLTDTPDAFDRGIRAEGLHLGLPGWWSKIELFRPGLFPGGRQVLYLDLDTLVVGELDQLAGCNARFAMLSDFYRPHIAESGVMSFTAGENRIWDMFQVDPATSMKVHADGRFIARCEPNADRLQDLYPGQIASFKVHAKAGPPADARLICAHGVPKFNQPEAGWAHHAWGAL